jgi:hypothetical protein
MKRLALFVGILLLVSGASALSLNFQNPSDFNSITCIGTCTWSNSATGGNSYVTAGTFQGFRTNTPSQFTYAAFTDTGSNNGECMILLDAGLNNIQQTCSFPSPVGKRIEMKMIGGEAYYYINGVYFTNSTPLSINPSYLQISNGYSPGGIASDDVVVGTTDSPYVFGMPQTNSYVIIKDSINTAGSGFAFSNGTIINSNFMSYTWSKNNGNNDTLYLATTSGTVVATAYTGTAYTGSGNWNLTAALFNNPSAPYGSYNMYSSGSGTRSTSIEYISTGASVVFNSKQYSQADTATITYSVSAGYWTPATYNYKMEIIDVSGNVVNTQTVTTQSGTKTYSWTTSNPFGVYYAALIATPIAGGSDIWMNYDYTNLNAYIALNGYVMNATTGAVLQNAAVNVTQLLSTLTSPSLSDGSWNSSNNWLTGSPITMNTTLAGYVGDLYTFTPQNSKTIFRNISLQPVTLPAVGTSIGGIVRDNVYGNPIPYALVSVQNVSASDYNTATTNIAGFYQAGNLVSGRLYNVWSSKTGYGNSSVWQVVAVGA